MPGIKGTMEEFETGTLHSGSKSGPVVTNRRQAVAIGMSEEARKVAAGGYGRGAMRKAAKVNPHGGYARGGLVKLPPPKAQPRIPQSAQQSDEKKHSTWRPGYAEGGPVQQFPPVTVTAKKMTQAEKDKYDQEQERIRQAAAAKGAPQSYAKGGPVVDPAPGPNDPKGGPYGPDTPGPVVGPGGPTADAVPINASNGEFVIPANVVSYLGQKFFQDLMTKAQTEMAQGQQPNAFADMAGPVPGDMTP